MTDSVARGFAQKVGSQRQEGQWGQSAMNGTLTGSLKSQKPEPEGPDRQSGVLYLEQDITGRAMTDRHRACAHTPPPHIRVLTLSQWKPVFPEGGNVANSPRVTLLLLP